MKKYPKFIFAATTIALLALSFSRCTLDLFKDYSDCEPSVELVSVQTENDTTTISAKITDMGESRVLFTGFCYNQTGKPEIDENQILFESDESDFEIVLSGLIPESTYYFKAFAANNCSYDTSFSIKYKVPISGPPTVPCSLNDNVIIDNSEVHTFESIVSGSYYAHAGEWAVFANDDGHNYQMIIDFAKKPINGIYFTHDSYDIDFVNNYKNVSVSLMTGYPAQNCYMDYNGLVYVETKDDGTKIISFCDLVYSLNGVDHHIKGRFVVK